MGPESYIFSTLLNVANTQDRATNNVHKHHRSHFITYSMSKAEIVMSAVHFL